MAAAAWTPWRRLRLLRGLPEASLAEVLDGGQSFRWTRTADGEWTGVFGRHVARLRSVSGSVEWSGLSGDAGVEGSLLFYLDAAGEQDRVAEALPWRSDAVLRSAMALHPGLRILRQDPAEALLCFLCSSNKRIVQIRSMVASLARELGPPVGGGHRALPGWRELAEADDRLLRACALGYRANYVRGTARLLADRPDWAAEWSRLETPALLERLGALPGVGPKVAACVALFGFGRLSAFPVDTWIVQALAAAYGLRDWSPARMAEFGRIHFGEGAGLAQQHLFAAVRAGKLPGMELRRPKAAPPRSRGRPRA
ncbi:MAG: DNA-3-methyladenine glycosylase family protein [Verrucomicrobiota bacterium]